MYKTLNQYHVVMEAAPEYWQNPDILRELWVRSPAGQEVPLNAFAHFGPAIAPLSVSHQGLFPAVTLSFNLQPGVALGDAVEAITSSARSRRPAPSSEWSSPRRSLPHPPCADADDTLRESTPAVV